MSHFEPTAQTPQRPPAALNTTIPDRGPSRALIQQMAQGDLSAVLTFAGQGFNCIDTLTDLYQNHVGIRSWVESASDTIKALVEQNRTFQWSGLYPDGFDLLSWILSPTTRPEVSQLTSSVLSQPTIFITQMVQYLALYQEGLQVAFDASAIRGLAGHSQGMMPALLIAESEAGLPTQSRFLAYVEYFVYQGLCANQAYDRDSGAAQDASTMASISGPDTDRLTAELEAFNETLPSTDQAFITLYNTRTRHVISGPVETLAAFHAHLDAIVERETTQRKRGQHGGQILRIVWENLAVGAPFHSPYMRLGLEKMRETVSKIGFEIRASALKLDVFSPVDGTRLNDCKDLTHYVMNAQFVRPVRWREVVSSLEQTQTDFVLDFGPSDGVARLTRATLRGSAVRVLALTQPREHSMLFTQGAELPKVPVSYETFRPQLVTSIDGLSIENAYTRATRMSPMILPGMTPTTVDAEIVAAAANAGHTAELAGGGQVTEEIFQQRILDLKQHLEPGREVVFNALYLDPYLWGLHLGRRRLVQQARAAGAPICGVTISAGMPEVDEAVRLLKEFHELDMWLNAFKPGTRAQVDQVLRIAKEVPQYTIFVHLEGGKAGGHHSWEDLDQLLLETYHKLRAQSNLVLCVGGGIATTERAVSLLTGQWSTAYGERVMPVDAVFLGTLTMACQEAKTSPQVKQALVDAAGTNEWVFSGQSEGEVTSGRSQLNADIHYIDNPAAHCGRLLDQVAGDEARVLAHRDAIIEALNATAKPYFGELEQMSYLEVASRLVSLMAIGQSGPYEDGVWMDRSWRERVGDWIRRCEARCATSERGQLQSILDQTYQALDCPEDVLSSLQHQYPDVASMRVHPIDVHYFLNDVCKRPGKPVNFVPVIDANVRRWYKADSLWQAHDARYDADQVLIIPGPEAVAGLTQIDEPVGALLGRFDAQLIESLSQDQSQHQGAQTTPRHLASLPEGVTLSRQGKTTTLKALMPHSDTCWFEYITTCFHGPIASLFATHRLCVGDKMVRNPARVLAQSVQGATLAIRSKKGVIQHLEYGRPDSLASLKVMFDTKDEHKLVVALSDEHGALTLPLTLINDGLSIRYHITDGTYADALSAFYCSVLFGEPRDGVELFESLTIKDVHVEAERARGYGALTGRRSDDVPMMMGFSLAWEALFRLLCTQELAGGLLDLVHQSHEVTTCDGVSRANALTPGDVVDVSAVLTSIEDLPQGRVITATATIFKQDAPVYQLKEQFFIRGSFAHTPYQRRRDETQSLRWLVQDDAIATFLMDLPWLTWSAPLLVGDVLDVDLRVFETRQRHGGVSYRATGQCIRDGEVVGKVDLSTRQGAQHPIDALRDVIGDIQQPVHETKLRTLATEQDTAPPNMAAFADVSRDLNPIHRDVLFAQMANLDKPIVHGMWGAARLWSFVVDKVGVETGCIETFNTQFLAPLNLGEAIELRAVRKGVKQGGLVLDVTLNVKRGDNWVPATRALVDVSPRRTAYVFPGQGIQQRGMGMEGYANSRAAKLIWDRADLFTRETLGFSILRIVRENPSEVLVNGRSWVHPKGVLNLTQFTQVAMAVLAQAQVAHMRDVGVLVDGAMACGHSVGEYNALGALIGVLPLEDVIEIVYQRGLAMHTLVPRDARGRSEYKMGVIRPHYARLSHEQAEALVASIREETGAFVQIVNYNVRGRQYSVTGHVHALEVLADRLTGLTPEGAKPAWIDIPGIDVPFHSEVLRDGVDAFRATLNARLPQVIEPQKLVGRYIPNLVPKPFSLERSFIEEIVDLTQTPMLLQVLEHFESWSSRPEALARVVLIELLAWQFASPVRWIETQEFLFEHAHGGQGVEAVVEVGVGYQPTLANMARYTARLMAPASAPLIVNCEAEADVVFLSDTDPEAPIEVAESAQDSDLAEVEQDHNAQTTTHQNTTQAVSVEPVADRPVHVQEALWALLAIQARVRPDQIRPDETIDELFDGVSSRRNQVLMDIGNEFKLAAIDGAHEKPLSELSAEVTRRASSWKYPGAYLKSFQDDALSRVLGRAGVSSRDVLSHLEDVYGLGDGLGKLVLLTLSLSTREGDSARGEVLGTLDRSSVTNKTAAFGLIEKAVAHVASQTGLPLGKRASTQATTAVDAGALRALDDKLAGPQGALMQSVQALASALGHQTTSAHDWSISQAEELSERVQLFEAEHGATYEALISPRFDAAKAVALTSDWAFAQRDVATLALDVLAGRTTVQERTDVLARLAQFAHDSRIVNTAKWYAKIADRFGQGELYTALMGIAHGEQIKQPVFNSTRPDLSIDARGVAQYNEISTDGDLVASLWPYGGRPIVHVDGFDDAFKGLLQHQQEGAIDFAGETALVTGASPGSIAMSMVGSLLRGSARVVIATTTTTPERLAFYKSFYQAHANVGAELHVVPFNQASNQDTDALVRWLFDEVTEQAGPSIRVLKRPFAPTLVIPFGAMKDLGTLDMMGDRSYAAIRAMLLGVERLVTGIARRYCRDGLLKRKCHVLLPLSPNHGGFGGDGVYAETKLGLEALLQKWHSERDAWGKALTLCGATIGWVRGTGLMDANNPIAARLEAHDVRTFNTDEMAAMLIALCAPAARERSLSRPLKADLTGGFADLEDIKGTVDFIRGQIEQECMHAQQLHTLEAQYNVRIDGPSTNAMIESLPRWRGAPPVGVDALDAHITSPQQPTIELSDVVVIVGAGEVGPCGSSRTRFELEVDDALSTAGLLELAWMTGLVRFDPDGGHWVDVVQDEPLAEYELYDVLYDQVRERVGIRFVDPETSGYDPNNLPVYATVYVEKDFSFTVPSESDARAFVMADPTHTRASYDAQGDVWRVTRLAGAEIKVPRQSRLNRQVAGLVPSGFDFSRFGIPKDMIQSVDKVTLFNLVATVDAFVSAGIEPEELLQWVHPSRVANTQGSGIGGMESLRRLYTDNLLGEARQNDALQETLINVVAAYVVQSYVGSYGPMSHPVAACATAAVSVEEGVDKILAGKADFAVSGGFDDIGRSGAIGFADMSATADSDAMLAMGLQPHQMSRANDERRRGFVESQGGGTILLARGDVAFERGLPVMGVVAWAGSFGDGIHKSIPAPGLGALAAAAGGSESPLGRALSAFDLTTDDIALVYKHDTSTAANDPNENALHHDIQSALGRTPGNPLWVVSQKTLTGHPKGGAAAWQMIGLCQAMATGRVPGNRNLDSVDDAMRRYEHMGFTDQTLTHPPEVPLRAGLVTSLGFGHVSAISLILHPSSFVALLPAESRQQWIDQARTRASSQPDFWSDVLMGQRQAFVKRTDRRFDAPDGSVCQAREESSMLLDPMARLNLQTGRFASASEEQS